MFNEHAFGYHHIGVLPGFFVISHFLFDQGGHVGGQVIVYQHRGVFPGFFKVYHGRQRVHVDDDVIKGIFGDVARFGDHHSQYFTGIADLIFGDGYDGACVELGPGDGCWRGHLQRSGFPEIAKIFGRINCHDTRAFQSFACIDLENPGVSIITAQECGMQLTGNLNVVYVLDIACQNVLVF